LISVVNSWIRFDAGELAIIALSTVGSSTLYYVLIIYG